MPWSHWQMPSTTWQMPSTAWQMPSPAWQMPSNAWQMPSTAWQVDGHGGWQAAGHGGWQGAGPAPVAASCILDGVESSRSCPDGLQEECGLPLDDDLVVAMQRATVAFLSGVESDDDDDDDDAQDVQAS